ncbi:MAG: NTP transferase domain-containing protein, partial [Candidatus Acidiferrales bacterium]
MPWVSSTPAAGSSAASSPSTFDPLPSQSRPSAPKRTFILRLSGPCDKMTVVPNVPAIILAAGRGRRLGACTNDRPKCLLQVGERTLIEHQL